MADEQRWGPNGEPLNDEGTAFWDGSHWRSLEPPYAVVSMGPPREPLHGMTVLIAVILTAVVALVCFLIAQSVGPAGFLVLLMVVGGACVAGVIGVLISRSSRARSVWTGVLIGAAGALVVSGVGCTQSFMG